MRWPGLLLALLLASVVAGIGANVAMVLKKEPFYGVVGLGIVCLPSSLLAFLYLAVA